MKSEKRVYRHYRAIGIVFLTNGSCYTNYEKTETFHGPEGYTQKITVVPGRMIRTAPGYQDLNGTAEEKKKSKETLMPEFTSILNAMPILLQQLRATMRDLDQQFFDAELQ